MVVVAQSRVSPDEAAHLDNDVVSLREDLVAAISGLSKRPQFIATYTFPQEFRRFAPRERGVARVDGEKCSYIPAVSFVGRVAINKS